MHPKLKIVLSVIVAIIIVSTSLAVVLHLNLDNSSPGKSIVLGPKVKIMLINSSSIPSFNSSTMVVETVEVMGFNASFMGNGQVISPETNVTNLSTGPELMLMDSTFNVTMNHLSHYGFLNSRFISLSQSWKDYFLSRGISSQEESLTIESILSITYDQKLSVYTYYNNIMYNPSSIMVDHYHGSMNYGEWFNNTSLNPAGFTNLSFVPTMFNVTPQFDMSKPFAANISENNSSVIQSLALVHPEGQIAPPCDPGTYYIPTSTRTVLAPVPLASIHISDVYNGSIQYPELLISEGISTTSISLYMNSAQVSASSSGTISSQMSTTPSWKGTGNFSNGIGTGGQWMAYAKNSISDTTLENTNNTTAILNIVNATYIITHYNIYYVWGSGFEGSSTCHDVYLGNSTSIEIQSISYSGNHNFTIGYGYITPYFQAFIQNLSLKQVNLGKLQPGGEMSNGTIYAQSNGYTNAGNEIQNIEDATGILTSAIGIGLAEIAILSAANGADGDATEGGVILDAASLLDSLIGYADTVATLFTSISFSTTSAFASDLFLLTAGTGNYAYNITGYETSVQTSFNVNGQTFYFNSPINFLNAS